MAGQNNWPYIINLGNSIIGVAVLAMPFCFKQCGIILAMLVLLFCTWLTLASCQILMKAGIVSRRRSYAFLAYFTHGATGKFLSEMGMIGMQVGTLIAQIVVIGDLGPAIISKLFGLENTSTLRAWLIICLCLCVGLPLGLLKDLRAVSRASTVCITFYTFFVLYIVFLSLPHLWTGSWYPHVHFWRPEGLFQCLPILSFSFGCQTQLFLLYDALPEPSLKAISSVISSAVNLCAVAYLVVGFFGYVTFYAQEIPGDILAIFPSTLFADVMKLCFVFSIVITFPVIIFPCRASIYTLLFSKKTKFHGDDLEGDVFMSEELFKGITVTIVVGSMITGILIPNVEFILGLNGAVVGTLICYIFPALFFLKVMGAKPEGKTIAQLVFVLGISIMLLSSYATLSSQDKGQSHIEKSKELMDPPKMDDRIGRTQPPAAKPPDHPLINSNQELVGDSVKKKETVENAEDKRHEPPNPDPPDSVEADNKRKKDALLLSNQKSELDPGNEKGNADKDKKEIDLANKAKEQELEEKEKKQDELLHELEKHRAEQEKLLKEQRELLKELKDHQEDDHKEVEEEKKGKVEPVNPINNEIVNQQQKIINQQQKVIEQQQEQLNQQKNMMVPIPGNLQENKLLSPGVQQVPQMNQQQPADMGQGQQQGNQQVPVEQGQPVGNQQVQMNQQQPLENQQVQRNQQQPLGNQQAQINQQQPLEKQQAKMNQQQPLENQQVQRNQQPPLGNQQVQMNQQQPLGNQQAPINQQQLLENQQVQMNQQQPLGNQHVQMNQQQPLGNQPVQMDQQQSLGNQPVQMNQQQPLGNQPVQMNQQQPLGNQPVQINQQQPLGNQQVQMNQQQILENQQI